MYAKQAATHAASQEVRQRLADHWLHCLLHLLPRVPPRSAGG